MRGASRALTGRSLPGRHGRPLRVKMISPAKTAADSPFWRPIKYSLFPPLGLATLAGYLDDGDEVTLQDEHVEQLDLDDEPDLVVIQVYITSAYRAYALADHYRAQGRARRASAGCTSTSLPGEAAAHADTIFLGPGEDTWPRLPARTSAPGRPGRVYRSTVRTLAGMPPAAPRPDQAPPVPRAQLARRLARLPARLRLLLQGRVLRGRPVLLHAGGRRRAGRDRAPARPPPVLPRRPPLRRPAVRRGALRRHARHGAGLAGGRHRATPSCAPGLLEKAVERGLRSLFVGFETLERRRTSRRSASSRTWAATTTRPSAACTTSASWSTAASSSAWTTTTPDVFDRTVEWAVAQGIETATFHILTPYPGTRAVRAHGAPRAASRRRDWDLYDTRHAVFRPARMTAEQLEAGYWRRLPRLLPLELDLRGGVAHGDLREHARHLAYTGGWKKLEPLWDLAIRAGKVHAFVPLLETILDRFRQRRRGDAGAPGPGHPGRHPGSMAMSRAARDRAAGLAPPRHQRPAARSAPAAAEHVTSSRPARLGVSAVARPSNG